MLPGLKGGLTISVTFLDKNIRKCIKDMKVGPLICLVINRNVCVNDK